MSTTDKPADKPLDPQAVALAALRATAVKTPHLPSSANVGAPDKLFGKGVKLFLFVGHNPKIEGKKIWHLWQRLTGRIAHDVKGVGPMLDATGAKPTANSEVSYDLWHAIGYGTADAEWDNDRDYVAVIFPDGHRLPKTARYQARGRS